MENMKDPEQKPFSGTDKDSYLSNIRIAIVPEKFRKQIEYHVTKFQDYIRKNREEQLIDFRNLHHAAVELRGLITQNSNDRQIPLFTKLLNQELEKYRPLLENWLTDMKNQDYVGTKMNQLKENLYDKTFYDLLDYLTFEKFNLIDDLNLNFFYSLQVDIREQTRYESMDAKGLVTLALKIKSTLQSAGLNRS
jgi:hypothetical protein